MVCENAKQATISMLDGLSAIPYSLQGIYKRKVKKNEKCKFVCVGNTIHIAAKSCLSLHHSYLHQLTRLATCNDGEFNKILLVSFDHQWHCQCSFYGF